MECDIVGASKQCEMSSVLNSIQQQLTPLPADQLELGQSMSANLCHAQCQLRKAKQEADQLHKQYLEALLNKAIVSNKMKKSKALTHLICAEQNKHCYATF